MNDKLRKIREKMLDAFEGRKRTAAIAGCAAVVFIAAACFPAIAAHQINPPHENSEAEERIAAGNASMPGGNPADQGNAEMKPGDAEASPADTRQPESQSAEEPTAAVPSAAGSSVAVTDSSKAVASRPAEGSAESQPNSPGYSQKTWVEDTERTWVVDRAAWVETIPVYESVERSVCNICGADITGSTSEHNKRHMLAGEGSGYHSEVRWVQVGEEAVEHPEEGHWETVVVGGHWE